MFLTEIITFFATNKVIREKSKNFLSRISEPESYYRESCVKLLREVRDLYHRLFPNQDLPVIFKFRHEHVDKSESNTPPTDGTYRPPIDLDPDYQLYNNAFGDNILLEYCRDGVAEITEFLTQLNTDSTGRGRLQEGRGNKNDSVRAIFNFIISVFVKLSTLDIKNITQLNDPVVFIEFVNTLQLCETVMNKKRRTSTNVNMQTVLSNVSERLMEIQGIIKACQSQKTIQEHFNSLHEQSGHFSHDLFNYIIRIVSTRVIPDRFSLLHLDLPLDRNNDKDHHSQFEVFILQLGKHLSKKDPLHRPNTSMQAIAGSSSTSLQVWRQPVFAMSYGYELSLITNDKQVEDKQLYVTIKNNQLSYKVKGIDGKLCKGTINCHDINPALSDKSTLAEIQNDLPNILKITSEKGHTLDLGILDGFLTPEMLKEINMIVALTVKAEQMTASHDKAKDLAQALGTIIAVFSLRHEFTSLTKMKSSLLNTVNACITTLEMKATQEFVRLNKSDKELTHREIAWKKNYSQTKISKFVLTLRGRITTQLDSINGIESIINSWVNNPVLNSQELLKKYMNFIAMIDSMGHEMEGLDIGYTHSKKNRNKGIDLLKSIGRTIMPTIEAAQSAVLFDDSDDDIANTIGEDEMQKPQGTTSATSTNTNQPPPQTASTITTPTNTVTADALPSATGASSEITLKSKNEFKFVYKIQETIKKQNIHAIAAESKITRSQLNDLGDLCSRLLAIDKRKFVDEFHRNIFTQVILPYASEATNPPALGNLFYWPKWDYQQLVQLRQFFCAFIDVLLDIQLEKDPIPREQVCLINQLLFNHLAKMVSTLTYHQQAKELFLSLSTVLDENRITPRASVLIEHDAHHYKLANSSEAQQLRVITLEQEKDRLIQEKNDALAQVAQEQKKNLTLIEIHKTEQAAQQQINQRLTSQMDNQEKRAAEMMVIIQELRKAQPKTEAGNDQKNGPKSATI